MTQADHPHKRGTKTYAVPGLDKGLEVIELLSNSSVSMSQADIARALGRSASEIFRSLSALESKGYIRRTQSGQYRLTLKLFELSRTHSPYEELVRIASPIMRDLSEALLETCHLTTLRGGEIVVLAQNEAPKPIRLSVEVGSRHSPLSTTSGRILLAAMNEQERHQYLRDYTQFDRIGQERRAWLEQRFIEVGGNGYEIADGERFVGGLDVGVLVGTPQSTIKAALIVATLRGAQGGPDLDRIRDAVIESGMRITSQMGLA